MVGQCHKNWVDDLSEFNEDFIKSYNEKSNEGCILEADIQYPENLHEPHNDLPFLPEIIKVDKVKKLVANFQDKKEYILNIRNLKQALNHELAWKKLHRAIKFNQKAWLKSYIDMNTDLRKTVKNDFEKDLFKLMHNSFFGKTMESVRKHRDIKLVTTEKKRNSLVSESNYHKTTFFSKNLIAMEMKKTHKY